MSIRFACPCGQELDAEPDHAGLETDCPACNRRLTIPVFSTAVRSNPASPRPRPPLTNRYNDDDSLAKPPSESDDDNRHRRNRHYDDEVHDEDEPAPGRPRMRPRTRDDSPTGINWTMVGGSALVMFIAAVWGVLSWFVGGFPVYQTIAFFAGLVGIVRGLLGRQRE